MRLMVLQRDKVIHKQHGRENVSEDVKCFNSEHRKDKERDDQVSHHCGVDSQEPQLHKMVPVNVSIFIVLSLKHVSNQEPRQDEEHVHAHVPVRKECPVLAGSSQTLHEHVGVVATMEAKYPENSHKSHAVQHIQRRGSICVEGLEILFWRATKAAKFAKESTAFTYFLFFGLWLCRDISHGAAIYGLLTHI